MAYPPSSSASSWSSGAPTLYSAFRRSTSPSRACASACGLTQRKVSGTFASRGHGDGFGGRVTTGVAVVAIIIIITVIVIIITNNIYILILLLSLFLLMFYHRPPHHDYNCYNYFYQCYHSHYYYNHPTSILLQMSLTNIHM